VEVRIGFAVGLPGEEMPYSTSVPMIRRMTSSLRSLFCRGVRVTHKY